MTRGSFWVVGLLVTCGISACGPSEEQAEFIEQDNVYVAAKPLVTCVKNVNLHLANWTYADRLDDSRSSVRPNGCWNWNMARELGKYWGHCKYNFIDNYGGSGNWYGGPKMWVYNETAYHHTTPSDEEVIANTCWPSFSGYWGVTPAKGYAYMMYRGLEPHWKRPSNWSTYLQWNFAELYGEGTWWPYWNEWKASPVGRPMANIVDTYDGGNTRTVTKGLCDYVTSGNWIGLWVGPNSSGLDYTKPAFSAIIQAMNDCTEGR